MGAGSFSAGLGPAGHDPVQPPAALVPIVPAQALLFDLASQDFVLDVNGQYEQIHPVDQAVALALGLRAGTLASVPTLGQTLRDIVRAAGPTLISDVTTRVDVALAEILARGDISLEQVTVTTPSSGQVCVFVDYINLRLPKAQQQATRVSL